MRTRLAGLILLSAAGCRAGLDPDISRMATEIDPARIHRSVETLVGFGTRHTMSETGSDTRGIGAARRWLQREFEDISRAAGGRLAVSLDAFMHGPDGNRITRPTEIVNVVAVLPGSQPASRQRHYVVSGHYDSICSDPKDPLCDAPGADDDASGVAVVLEMARVMSTREFDATIVFMAVAGEEQGLIGSRHWAADARRRGLQIEGMFTNDIVGASVGPSGVDRGGVVRVFSEGVPVVETPAEADRRRATGSESDSPARQLARAIDESAAAYLPGFDVDLVFRRDRYLRGGDHTAFSEQGYPAVRFTEYEENYEHQHQNVRLEGGRQFGDLIEYCDAGYMARVAQANLVAMATLARAPATPKNVRIVTAKLINDTTLRWDVGTEPDLAGYEVVWRHTTAPGWQHHQRLGKVGEATLPFSKDNVHLGVRAVDTRGHLSPAATPKPARE